MLALACCGDGAGMVRLMDWLLDGWDREYVREEAKTAHSLDYHYTMRTIAYFAEMGGAGDLVDSGEMDRLRQRLDDMRWEKGCTWFWPEEGWQGEAPVQALPELETDLVVVERWPRLRQMVCSADASPEQEQQRNEEQEEARDFG
jgi:DNA (cytosine-5)-methyltransferase 1